MSKKAVTVNHTRWYHLLFSFQGTTRLAIQHSLWAAVTIAWLQTKQCSMSSHRWRQKQSITPTLDPCKRLDPKLWSNPPRFPTTSTLRKERSSSKKIQTDPTLALRTAWSTLSWTTRLSWMTLTRWQSQAKTSHRATKMSLSRTSKWWKPGRQHLKRRWGSRRDIESDPVSPSRCRQSQIDFTQAKLSLQATQVHPRRNLTILWARKDSSQHNQLGTWPKGNTNSGLSIRAVQWVYKL